MDKIRETYARQHKCSCNCSNNSFFHNDYFVEFSTGTIKVLIGNSFSDSLALRASIKLSAWLAASPLQKLKIKTVS